MTTSFWRRWCQSLLLPKPTRPVARARSRCLPLGLEALEDRVTPSLTPQMVLDINPGLAPSSPAQMAAIGPTTYFTADDGVHGVELWKSDGTAAGTALVKDINPGSAGSAPRYLTNVNGTLFFTPSNGAHGGELWKSDGTAAGTTLVKNFYPGLGLPDNLTNVNGTLFFTADDGTAGRELWKSDGTAAGTTLVKDIYPGSTWGYYNRYFLNSSNPGNLTNVNGTLFFTADDGSDGRELWKSDGTAAGTTLVEDIYPGGIYTNYGFYWFPNSSNPSSLTNVNGTLFFTADDGTAGPELWRSDGTAAGTTLVKDIIPGIRTSNPDKLTNVNGTLFFTADDGTNGRELWKSNGTAAGTTLVKDIIPGSAGSFPGNLTNVNGTLFFAADDGTHGWELWKSNGTAAGTTLVKDIKPGSATSLSRYLPMTNVSGTLFFMADDGVHGPELWQSDGTAAGTTLVKDIYPGSGGSNPIWLTNVNGKLFFAADDGIHGRELWTLVAGPTQGTILGVSGFPAAITAGVVGTFTVTAKNADGTTNAGYRGTVHFTSSDPLAVLPADYTFTAADAGMHTFSAILKTAGSQSITTTDTVAPGSAGTQAGITVNPAAASRFTVAGFPSPVTAGVAGSFTVTAWDAYGNRASGYTGTVRFASTDAAATLPANYTFTAADAGVHTFSATLKTAGPQSLTGTDTATAALTGVQSVTVNPAAASRLVLTAPASVRAGAKFSLTVTVLDAYGNVVPDYRGTLAFRSSDSTAGLPQNYRFTAGDQGTHTFTGLVLKKKGKQTITATDTLNSYLTVSVLIAVL